MQNYSENYNLSNKNWRAIQYDWDTLANFDPTNGKLYCLSDFQASWLQANVPYLSWITRQENCPCTPEELAEMASELEYALMSCVEFNPYQQQYVYDQAVQDQLNTFDTDYNGTPSSVNPDAPDDFFSGDGSVDRLDALCSACMVYCYSYSADWQVKAQIALAIAGVFGALASISIVGGVIASVLIGGLAFITQTAYDAMTDVDALDDVVCCMKDNMTGLAITQANFETSLDSCSFMVGSNQAIIRDIIASDMGQLGNYLTFINALGDQLLFAQNNVNVCPCPETWVSVIDFTISDYGFIFNEDTGGGDMGVWTLGVGLVGVCTSLGGVGTRSFGQLPFTASEVTRIDMTTDMDEGTIPGFADNFVGNFVRGRLGTVQQGTLNDDIEYNAIPAGPTTLNLSTIDTQTIDNVYCFGRSSLSVCDGSVVITGLTIYGNGIKPPELP